MAGGREVVVLRAPNPGPLTRLGTNTWIYGAGESLVIDPGPADEAHLTHVVKAATRLGPVAAGARTHHHQDHVAGAARLCELTGAPLAVHHRRPSDRGSCPSPTRTGSWWAPAS